VKMAGAGDVTGAGAGAGAWAGAGAEIFDKLEPEPETH
jgi:hypothetical protein